MSEPNPYQSPSMPAESPAPSRRPGEDALYFAAQWHNIIGGVGLLLAIFGAVFWTLVILDNNPVDPSIDPSALEVRGTAFRNAANSVLMALQSLLMLAGGISMHQHKRRWLAIVGAWAGISPLCGCYVFSLMTGIWVLIILRRPEVKSLFAANQPSGDKS